VATRAPPLTSRTSASIAEPPIAADDQSKPSDALREWVAQPSAAPRFESEALLKVFFGEHGDPAQLIANLDALRESAREGVEHFREIAETYAAGKGRYPERFALSALAARLLIEQQITLERWAAWAKEVVSAWETTDEPEPAEWGVATMQTAGEPYELG
jgi:hypothetical protein